MKDRKWWNSVPAWWRPPPPTPPPPPPIPPPENLPELPEGLTPDDVLGVKTRHSLDLTDLPPVRASVPRARSTPPRRRREGVEGIPDISFSFFNEQTAPVDMEAGTTVVLGEHSTLVVSKKSPNISCINILSVNNKQQSENTYASPSSPSSSISISPNTLDAVSTSSVVISPNQPDISTITHSAVSVNLNQSDNITPISSSVIISPGPSDMSTRNSLPISPILQDRDSAVSTTPNQGAIISNVIPKASDKTIPHTSITLPTSSQQLPPNKYKPLTLPRSSVFPIGNEPVTTNSFPNTSFISPTVSVTAESSPNTPTTPTFSNNGHPPNSIAVESPPTTPNSSTVTFVSTTANPPSYTNSAMEDRVKIGLSTSPIVSSISASRITTQESAPSTPTSPTPTCTSIDANPPSNKNTSPGDSPPTTPTSPTSAVSTDVNPPSSAPTPPSDSPPTTPTEPIPITSTPIESRVNTKPENVNAAIDSCPTTPTTPTDPVLSAFPDTSPSSPCSLDSPRAALTISLPLELTSCPDWETITEYSEYYYGKREHGSDYEDVETRQEYCEHRAEDPRQRRATLMRDRRLGRVRTRIRRAWRAVRGWWSDERLRIGDAIQRHAHAQAVKQDDEEKTVVVRRKNPPRQDNSRPSSRAGARRSRHIPETLRTLSA
ncbi:hypothetical protein C0J52_06426 [Blattella germanica]|nr:hypothetical protein C0J52_06426 [Blattella germanica]